MGEVLYSIHSTQRLIALANKSALVLDPPTHSGGCADLLSLPGNPQFAYMTGT